MAGGRKATSEVFFNSLRRLSRAGEMDELAPMQTAKAYFPMVWWNVGRSLITIGGTKNGDSNCVKETERYDFVKKAWTSLPNLPVRTWASAATIFGAGHLYSFGGRGALESGYHMKLSSHKEPSEWGAVRVKGGDFSDWMWRDAAALGN